jgi:hypothetical protein
MAMIAMTTSSSIKVNPHRLIGSRETGCLYFVKYNVFMRTKEFKNFQMPAAREFMALQASPAAGRSNPGCLYGRRKARQVCAGNFLPGEKKGGLFRGAAIFPSGSV